LLKKAVPVPVVGADVDSRPHRPKLLPSD
jgi:hypothetical protein